MTKHIEERIDKLPVVNIIARFLKRVRLPGFEGLSVYDLIEMYGIGIIKGALTARAGAIAYSFFMAIFPFLFFILTLIPHIEKKIPEFKEEFLSFLESFLPTGTTEFFSDTIFNSINGAGLISSVFLISMLLMTNGVNAVFSGFENSYHVKLTRNMFRQYLYAFWVSLILAFLLIATVAGLGYFELYVMKSGFAKYGFSILMVYLATTTLYYFGTKEGRASKFFSIGALFTTLLIMINSYLFGIYIENFSQYNQLYGSIGALLILLVYLWLNANILLLGFELNISLRKLREKYE